MCVCVWFSDSEKWECECAGERADTENNATDIYIQIIFFFFS